MANTVLASIIAAFPAYTFASDSDCFWSPETATIHYCKQMSEQDVWDVLHEIGHAQLGHRSYDLDVSLLRNEVAAWEHAMMVLAPRFKIVIDPNYKEAQLDTYRDWLYARSLCPNCQHAGIQKANLSYQCFNCSSSWHANDARRRRLKRTRSNV